MPLLQDMTPFGQSLAWDLLDRFYTTAGPAAWSEEIVPQGATSNCYTADTYAQIAAAFLRDMAKLTDEKPLIIELGGGNGRFAFQFLNRLNNYHGSSDSPLPDYTYLLTDAADRNLEQWETQKRFAALKQSGKLEFGQLWVAENPVIKTKHGKLTPEDLSHRPVLFIANYLFDSVRSNMIRIKDKEIHQVLMSLNTTKDDFFNQPLNSFDDIEEDFTSTPLNAPVCENPILNDILQDYAAYDGDFHVVVPEVASNFLLAFMQREAPMMMIAGDLAYTDPSEFRLTSPMIFKSYFAHYTNFHIFSELFRRHAGHVQFQRHRDPDFANAAFMLPGNAYKEAEAVFTHTRQEARAALQEFYSYDAHELTEMINDTVEEASFRQVLAWIRFSKYDPAVAAACLPLLFEQIQQGQEDPDVQQLYSTFMECYQAYFPEQQTANLDYAIAQFFLALKLDSEAFALLTNALVEFGPSAGRLYVYAIALLRFDQRETARKALEQARTLDPSFGPALRLYENEFGVGKPDPDALVSHLSVSFADKQVVQKVAQTFDTYGAVLIENMIQPDLLKALQSDFQTRVDNWQSAGLGEPNNVGDKRFTVPIRFTPPFNDPALYANPILIDLLTEAMGARPIISAFGSVVTHAGARMQHIHREHPLLFTSNDAVDGLPTYAVTVLIPLVDLDEEFGGTQLWERSHTTDNDASWEGDPTVVYTKAGSALVFDYRMFHGGMACTSQVMRPVLFFSYGLPWFRDTLAFESHAAFGLTKDELATVPDAHKDLFRFAKIISD